MPDSGKRAAAVSAFGFSGTNAHIILQEATTTLSSNSPDDVQGHYLLCISAKTTSALQKLVSKYVQMLTSITETNGDTLRSVCYASATCRTHMPFRLSVYADDIQQMIDRTSHTHTGPTQGVYTNCVGDNTHIVKAGDGVAFVFSGRVYDQPNWYFFEGLNDHWEKCQAICNSVAEKVRACACVLVCMHACVRACVCLFVCVYGCVCTCV